MATIHYTHQAYCQGGCTQEAHRPQEAHLCLFIEHTEHSLFYVKSYMATMAQVDGNKNKIKMGQHNFNSLTKYLGRVVGKKK